MFKAGLYFKFKYFINFSKGLSTPFLEEKSKYRELHCSVTYAEETFILPINFIIGDYHV